MRASPLQLAPRAGWMLVMVFGLVSAIGCGPRSTSTRADTAGPEPTVPSGLSILRFESFDDAASYVGFGVPRTDVYPLNNQVVYVQQLNSPTARRTPTYAVKAVFKVAEGQFIHLSVEPASSAPEEPLADRSREVTLGGRHGWRFEASSESVAFAFRCDRGQYELMCFVDTEFVAMEAIERFVASLS